MIMIIRIFQKVQQYYWNARSSKLIDNQEYNTIQYNKIPYVIKHPTAKISIGNGTTINSNNKGYHLNMFSKCKLYADTPYSIIEIGENCRIHGTCIHAQKSIKIGNNVLIAANTQIIDSNGHELNMDKPQKRLIERDEPKEIIIEDNVWIGTGCIILKGSHIKEGAVISAGSVVKGIIPAHCIFGGNPAKLIKQY
ncbi:MAG: acyltransferase [Brumimicrobium sp.]|nr:acyltransferase [Brumimicrobium sp.]